MSRRKNKSDKNICEACYYYSRTRYGAVCSFTGKYNPSKKNCANFKSRTQTEAEELKSIELTKLLLSIVNKLIQLQPEIEKIENKELKESLTEICLAAKQIKTRT